jgi:hypothetical protein
MIPAGKSLSFQLRISPASNSKIGDKSSVIISVNSEANINITDSATATAIRVK